MAGALTALAADCHLRAATRRRMLGGSRPVADGGLEATMPHFFLKLIPPRPTFATDLSDAEAARMKRHAGYLATLLESGEGVAFGPVMDPSGVFGMGVVEAEDEAAARAITDNDPVVVEGLGRYEIFPMRLLKKEQAR